MSCCCGFSEFERYFSRIAILSFAAAGIFVSGKIRNRILKSSTMKKLGLILICLFAGLATNSCSDSDEAPVEDMLTVLPDVKTVTFSASGETLYADDRPIDPVFRITTTAANCDF